MQTNDGFTIVTVVFEGDVAGLEMQARSVARHADSDLISDIVVIENFACPAVESWRSDLLNAYGAFSGRVRFVRSGDLTAGLTEMNGWWSQQVAKLEVARKIRSSAYLVLDAKHHLTKRLNRSFLQGPDGRLRIRSANYAAHPLKLFLNNVISEFALEPSIAERFPTTTPPFPLWTESVLHLIQHAETEAGSLAHYMFDRQLTEFFLYSGFLASGGTLNDLYELHDLAYPMIWPGQSSDEKCRDLVGMARQGESPFFAVHRRAIGELSPYSRREIFNLWIDAELVGTEDEGARFLDGAHAKTSMLSRIKGHLRNWR